MDSYDKKCWCCVTYVFSMDGLPPLPLPQPAGSARLAASPAGGFEPAWFLNARFPEDDDLSEDNVLGEGKALDEKK